jgi:arylsulfatase A-like enzyme
MWGSLTGLVESLVHLGLGTNPSLGRFVIVDSIVVYAAIWAILGLFAGLALSLIWRQETGRMSLFLNLFFFLFSVFYAIGYYVNVTFLPEVFAKMSLLFDACLLAALVLIGRTLYSKIALRLGGRSPRWRTIAAVWLLFVASGMLIGFWPSSREGGGGTLSSPQVSGEVRDYNVLLILIDTLRKDHMSLYGYGKDTTPHIKKYFGEGMWFARAFAQSSHTKPSTASLLTSLYVSSHNMSRLTTGLPAESVTAAEVFKSLGYNTAMFSVNSFVSPFFGFDQGVDYFFAYHPREITSMGLYNMLFKVERNPLWITRRLSKAALRLVDRLDVRRLTMPGTERKVSDESATDALLQWLEDNREERFFAYIHYLGPHSPYDPPPPYDELYIPHPNAMRPINPKFGGFLPFSEAKPIPREELENMVGQYDGEINLIDDQIGRIAKKLGDLKLDRKTLVIITADHGEEFYDHKGWLHGHSLYNEVIGVPLLLWQPELINRSGPVDAIVQHIDLLPTILELLGYRPPAHMQGESFAEWLIDSTASLEDRHIITEIDLGGLGARSIISDGYKYIYSFYGLERSRQLFDLRDDQAETHDLSESEASLAQKLGEKLEESRQASSQGGFISKEVQLNEELKGELKELGYIE